jgi:hypothetical protein
VIPQVPEPVLEPVKPAKKEKGKDLKKSEVIDIIPAKLNQAPSSQANN